MRRSLLLPLILILAAAAVASCRPAAELEEADRAAIQDMLEAYLPRLAAAYASGDVTGLETWAAAKEISQVEKRIRDLAVEGRRLEPRFRQLTIEDVTVWGYANAYVTTVEVWDLVIYAVGAERELAREEGQTKRYKYQLKRKGDRWRVLYRTVLD